MKNTSATAKSRFASLKNMALMQGLANTLIDRKRHVPGFGVFYGPSGFGKSQASIYTQLRTEATRIEIGESWTNKRLLQAILQELGVAKPKGTLSDLSEKAIDMLSQYPDQLLIIDEADKLIRKKHALEIVRELQEHSGVSVILIGEENLSRNLEPFERVHNRVLRFVGAEPCDLNDAQKLADFYCPSIKIDEPLLERIRSTTNGRARRIVTTLEAINEFAAQNGLESVTDDAYQGKIYSGESPRIRQVGR